MFIFSSSIYLTINSTRSFSIQFRLMICGNDAQLQGMPARRDAIQCPLFALKHTHEFAVDVRVHVMAALALG